MEENREDIATGKVESLYARSRELTNLLIKEKDISLFDVILLSGHLLTLASLITQDHRLKLIGKTMIVMTISINGEDDLLREFEEYKLPYDYGILQRGELSDSGPEIFGQTTRESGEEPEDSNL